MSVARCTCPKCNKPINVRLETHADGVRGRVIARCGCGAREEYGWGSLAVARRLARECRREYAQQAAALDEERHQNAALASPGRPGEDPA